MHFLSQSRANFSTSFKLDHDLLSQQLKANMRELENTRLQVRNEEISAFEMKIAPIKKQAVEAISSFGNLQADLVQRMGSIHVANSPGWYSFIPQIITLIELILASENHYVELSVFIS